MAAGSWPPLVAGVTGTLATAGVPGADDVTDDDVVMEGLGRSERVGLGAGGCSDLVAGWSSDGRELDGVGVVGVEWSIGRGECR